MCVFAFDFDNNVPVELLLQTFINIKQINQIEIQLPAQFRMKYSSFAARQCLRMRKDNGNTKMCDWS